MAAASSPHYTEEVIADVGDSKYVQLVYDTWTPRPHFIVVQYKPQREASSDELQATYELISRFLRTNPQYDNEAILSFHRGKWYQKHTGDWHAHLCVPKEPYLEQARIKITEIPNNKEWKGARTIDEGINNWYRKNEQDVHLSTLDANSREFKLIWTSPAPHIGVKALSPTTTTLASLYKFMSEVRANAEKKLGQHDSKFANFGCHLCLYVCGQSGMTVTCVFLKEFYRDTIKFAIKYFYIELNGINARVIDKKLITDPCKHNKSNHLKLPKNNSCDYQKLSSTDYPEDYENAQDQLVTLFKTGKVLQEYSLETIRPA
ncbi:unnamed protein product [Rotaria sp. Silwood1]|nr:unnamed protein product [Rotaria sp. Silwood1]CAF0925348.1 unnamed protein product [Rotaria sp. Silwood1]CAF0951438.1 unnamed protein product [Rotaria sp. Silwood1]CAF3362165.1 unnamed protein product [Rotaria sp. Silwood1]CAF3385368.1 unnamed protein product [Rotaria sp. Silwood1]